MRNEKHIEDRDNKKKKKKYKKPENKISWNDYKKLVK